ncbi:hypothetical protein CVD28_05500 [Bacillus sp. M6-12]|uniref:TAXI family TRAP transporter solute-binding subunit n=1 Tax=Bacillus sp. M6-12 TaxID=2054166 RepID=UPI000C76E25E|nr:TAXI family TRAP transporter solute-binding subunit [Bacillus sp. M6-12]PLS18594.1 hypothetical protein CVD28_05500 [Bacillus sp. M6-12]
MKLKNSILISIFTILFLALAGCNSSNETSKPVEEKKAGGKGEGNVSIDDSPVDVTLAGASAGGLWQVIGESLANAVRQEYPNSAVSYEPGNPAGSLIRLINQETEMAGSPSVIEMGLALKGEAPFTQAYSPDDFYVLGKVYSDSAAHVLMRKDVAEKYGVESLDDIREKKVPVRISLNQRGNLSEFTPGSALLEAHDITLEDIEKWGGEIVYSASSQTVEEMKDGKLDLFIGNGFPPHGKFTELASTTDLVMLKLDDNAVQEVIDKWNLYPYTFKAGVYDFLDEDINSYALDAYFLIGSHVSEDVGYKLAKAVHENLDSIKSAYASFDDLTIESFLDVGEYKLHPGAERYFKEQGLLK